MPWVRLGTAKLKPALKEKKLLRVRTMTVTITRESCFFKPKLGFQTCPALSSSDIAENVRKAV